MEKGKWWYLFTWFIATILFGAIAPVAVTTVDAANTKNIVDRVLYIDADYRTASGSAENNIIIREDDMPFSTGDTFRVSFPSGVNWLKDEYISNDVIKILSVTERDLELQIIDPSNLAGDIKKELKLPLYFEITDAEGEIKLTIDPRESMLTGGQYTIAVVGGMETSSFVDKVQTVYNDHSFDFKDSSKLRIDANTMYTFRFGDTFRLELPPGVKWNSDIVDFIENDKGTIIDEQTLEIEIQERSRLMTIYIPLMVTIDGFRGELQVHIVPLDSHVTEEKITFSEVVLLQLIEKSVSFPKTKINVKAISYDNNFGSIHAYEGLTFAKVDMDVWIEEEPKDKVSWSATDFLQKWVLNDGREISEGSFTTGSSSSVGAGKWKNITVALAVRDYQKIVSIYVVDPLNDQNTEKVVIEEFNNGNQIELKALPKNNSIELTWDSHSEAEYYQLYRSKVDQGEFDPIAITTTQDTIYIDTDVRPNITYWYKVSAVKENTEFQQSNIVKAILRPNNNGSSTGGGGGGPSSDAKEISALNGGSIEKDGAKVEIPANAHISSFKATMKKVTNTSVLVTAENSKIISDVYEITKDKSGEFEKAVTITLPFDKSKYDATNYDIGIYWFNEVLEKWIKLENVEVDLNNGKVSGKVNHFTKFAVIATVKENQFQETPGLAEDENKDKLESATPFSDINGHWAEKEITQLVNKGFLSGYPDQTFKPNQTISRAEFASILVKVLNLKEVDDGKVFNDTSNHWAQGAIMTAHSYGIINGYNESTFGVNDPITREQLAAMIVKAFKLKYIKPIKTFKDGEKTSKWAVEAVETAIGEAIMGGYEDGSIKPQGNATRGEAVAITIRALNR